MPFPGPIEWLPGVPALQPRLIATVEKIREFFERHVMLRQHRLKDVGVPDCMQVREIVLAVNAGLAWRFVFILNRHTIAAPIAVGFVVQGLVNVPDKMNQETQGVGADLGIGTRLKLLGELIDHIDDAALLTHLADVVFVSSGGQRDIDEVIGRSLWLIRANVVGPSCGIGDRG
jgi:hypothetical protein